MSSFKRHALLLLGLAPVVSYAVFVDFEGKPATPVMKAIWAFSFICIGAYLLQRFRAFRDAVSQRGGKERQE
jgi:hypothetical protein